MLKSDGLFISITFTQPHFRKPVYAKTKYDWSIEQHTFGETFHFFFYIMRKGKTLSDNDKKMGIKYEDKTLYGCGSNEEITYFSDSDDEDYLVKKVLL